MRRNAVALAFLLFLGQLFIIAAPAEPALADGSVIRHGHDFANLPVTGPKPHNLQAAQVPQAQLPMDVPPVAKPALARMSVRLLTDAIRGAGVAGETAILERLPSIRERYLLDVDAPPRMRSRWARLNAR